MRIPFVLAIAAMSVAAGCITPGTVGPGDVGLPDAAALLARPWLGNWGAVAGNFSVLYEPDARVAVEGTLDIRNDLGEPREYVTMYLASLAVTKVEDETGAPLEFTVTKGLVEPFGSIVPEGAQDHLLPGAVVNITLTGDVSHGAVRTLALAYEGWTDESSPAPVGHAGLPRGLPNEYADNLHFGILPILANTDETEMRFTLDAPADWTVLASAGVASTVTENGRTLTHYAVKSPYVAITSLKGAEFLEDYVDGIQVKTWFYPDERLQGRVAHDISIRVIREMVEFTGAYPYDHIWTVPNGAVMNAFSTPGLTFMGLNFYRFHLPNAPYQFGRFTPYVGGKDGFEMVVVHEHIHNWWGHNVGGNNSNPSLGTRDNWITEGITTYLSETVWFRDQYGESDAAASAQGKWVDQVVRRRGNTLPERGVTEAGSDHYEKTAISLRALEAYGIATGRPTAVFDALKLIQARYGLVDGGRSAVTSHEAYAVFEEAFGENLSWMWDSYFGGPDLSDFRVAGVKTDGTNVTVDVANGKVLGAVQVRATTATGVTFLAWGVVPAGSTAPVYLTRPAGAAMDPVVRVELDPYHWVYEADETNNAWIGVA